MEESIKPLDIKVTNRSYTRQMYGKQWVETTDNKYEVTLRGSAVTRRERVTSGFNNQPAWARKETQIITSPYSLTDYREEYAPGVIQGSVTRKEQKYVSEDTRHALVRVAREDWPTVKFVAKPDDGAVVDAYAKARAAEVDILTALAESPESARLIWQGVHAFRQPAQTLMKQLRGGTRVRKNLKGLKDLGNIRTSIDPAGAILQWNLGVMPLYYQLNDLVDLYQRTMHHYYEFRASRTDGSDEVVTTQRNIPIAGLPGSGTMVFQWRITDQVRTRAWIKQMYELGKTRDMATKSNLALTAWELVWASWLVDYVIRVGDWLQAFTPTCATTEVAMRSVATVREVTLQGAYFLNAQPTNHTAHVYRVLTQPKYMFENNAYDRAYTGLGAVLSTPPPLNKHTLKVSQYLNAGALTWSSTRSSLGALSGALKKWL